MPSKCPSTTAGSRAKASLTSTNDREDVELTKSSLGFTSDALGRLIKLTALNPAFTLPLILLSRYTKRGADLTADHPVVVSQFWKLFYFGLARYASGYLDDGALNNWTKDTYDWTKEIVLITGGAGGIGGEVVKLLSERNIKVVVLDVIPMTFEARQLHPSPPNL